MLTMPDTLRDRIAAVLYGNLRRQQGIDRPDRFLDWIDTSELADAVIEALGLREEREDVASFQPGEIDDSMMPPRQKGRLTWTPSHRYVTEWQPDA
jgi:hypothetical protein